MKRPIEGRRRRVNGGSCESNGGGWREGGNFAHSTHSRGRYTRPIGGCPLGYQSASRVLLVDRESKMAAVHGGSVAIV